MRLLFQVGGNTLGKFGRQGWLGKGTGLLGLLGQPLSDILGQDLKRGNARCLALCQLF